MHRGHPPVFGAWLNAAMKGPATSIIPLATTIALVVLAGAACAGEAQPSLSPASSTQSGSVGVDAGAARAKELEDYAKHLNLSPAPKVDVVRYVTLDEQPVVFARCMADSGFAADDEGEYSAPSSQIRSLNVALYTCTAKYPLQDRFYQPYTIEQKRIIYDYFVAELVPCLQKEGFSPPPPPTFETFLATIGTASEYTPYSTIAESLQAKQLRALQDKCHDLPPNSRLGP